MSALMDKILFTDITVQGERSWCTDEYKGNQKDNGNCDSAESGPLGPAADRIHHDGSVLSSQQITAEQRCASAGPPTVRHNDIDDGSLGSHNYPAISLNQEIMLYTVDRRNYKRFIYFSYFSSLSVDDDNYDNDDDDDDDDDKILFVTRSDYRRLSETLVPIK
ncbi:hypothetical protein HZH68_002435 [Vespula germanica]|uniref:Uncharacterized protein n=1 Tax=Vespula germanica TaxID=30212 RepID=A0A834NMA5_VESGE|nr:hypothetical protein HZH68_002435 [Vespula germanica]